MLNGWFSSSRCFSSFHGSGFGRAGTFMSISPFVMAGLSPSKTGVNALLPGHPRLSRLMGVMDARHKAGHDGIRSILAIPDRRAAAGFLNGVLGDRDIGDLLEGKLLVRREIAI